MNAEIRDLTEEQITDLKAQIADWEKAQERNPLVFRPKLSEDYWILRGNEIVECESRYQDSAESMQVCGNCFETKELAEAELKRRQVVRQIEELVDKYDPERGGAFVDSATNYKFLYYNAHDNIRIDWWRTWSYNPMIPTFSTHEVAKRILEEVGEDNIKLLFMKYPIVKGEE